MAMKLQFSLVFAVFLVGAGSAMASNEDSAPPRIFFTDLTSGPNSGGLDDNGAILTIYGKRFGRQRERSTVTVGGGLVAKYLLWSDTKISVEIGPAAATGSVVVRTHEDDRGKSNGVPFTVRPGNIYCVSTAGNDANSGAFPSSCWTTLVMAKNAMVAGDITYALDGVTQNAFDAAKSTLFITTSGTADMPIALVAFPGAKVSIGIPTWGDPNHPIRDGVRIGDASHWVLAGMFIQGIQALNFKGTTDDWRAIGNELTCPNASGEMYPPYTADFGFEGVACTLSVNATNLAYLGNNVHDTGQNCAAGLTVNGGNGNDACKLYHAVYFSTSSVHLDVGWNTIAPNGGGCRALQFHSTDAADQFDISVHDNVIHDSPCDGLNFATVDPSQGRVQAYNNVIYNAGNGPDPGGKFANYACIYSADITNAGNNGAGAIEIYNNTLYNCGSRSSRANSGAVVKSGAVPTLTMNLRNNVVYQTRASDGTLENYVAGDLSGITGTNNLWFGAGPAPSGFTNSLDANPQFVDLPRFNFRLRRRSPAVDAGVDISGLLTDIDGIVRTQGDFDLGAYQVAKEPDREDQDFEPGDESN
jgi:hypothetical protein